MAEIRVTSKELKNKAEELRRLNSNFKNAVETMTQNEKSLMGMWDGEAKDAFHKAFESDRVQMDTFYTTIEQYCRALENDAANYEKAEQRNLATAAKRTYK